MNKIWKVIDVVEWGKGFFNSKGIESPRLNIELILCHVLKIDRIKLYTGYDLPLNSDELAEIKRIVLLRVKRFPLQYLLGKTSFMGLEICVNSDVLIPRPETEELVEHIINKYKDKGAIKILEIGTGSGCIALALGKYLPNSQIHTIDISERALELAKINSELNKITNINFEKKDFLKNCNFLDNYDVLVSNPPYISKKEYEENSQPEIMFEPRNALTDESDGLEFYRKFASEFKKLLKQDGVFFVEMAYNQSRDVSLIFSEFYDIRVYKDFSGIDRYIEGCVKIE
jgi:release factor glutamine methyltransferase